MRHVTVCMCVLVLSLLMMGARRTIDTSTVIFHNKTNQPVLVFPIPKDKPPYVLARIPQQQEGVITAPAKIGWPGTASAMIVVKESQKNNFDLALQQAIAEFNTSKNKSLF